MTTLDRGLLVDSGYFIALFEAVLEYTIEIIRFLIGMAACFTHMPMDSRNLGSYDPFADADTVQTGCGDNTLKVIDSF